MKMKQSSQPLISTGMLPWGIDQWFFISSMMILMMLISNPISSSESMNFLRALTWKSRRPSHLHQINTISLFPVWATGKTSDSLRSRWVAASSRGPGLLCAPRDAPAVLQPLPHRALVCCLEHHPPGAALHWAPTAAGGPGRLPGPSDGREGLWHGKDGPHSDCEEVLPGHPCLPERKGIQWLRLGNHQSGDDESPLFINHLAKKVKKDGWRSELTLRWLSLTKMPHHLRTLTCVHFRRLWFLLQPPNSLNYFNWYFVSSNKQVDIKVLSCRGMSP